MEKKINIVLLLIVVGLFGLVCYSNVRNEGVTTTETEREAKEDYKLELEPEGTYNMPGFGDEFFIYRFDSPNDNVIVYQMDCIYLVGEDAGKNGTSYASMVMKDSQFIALSDKYLLFITGEDKIAVAMEEKKDANIGESVLQKYSYNELSDKEKEAFIYPIAYEKVIQ